MLSFLKSGDIANSIRGLTNLPGISTADSDKIKYALLNHSMAMRQNLSNGNPIFTNIRALEVDIETRDIANITSGRLPSMAENAAAAAAYHHPSSSLFTDSELGIDNPALAFIMAKELAFLNRTIQMISFVTARYREEQDDAVWGRRGGGDGGNEGDRDDDEDDDSESGDDGDLELGRGYDGDDTPSILSRSQSNGDAAPSTVRNQLSATFLVASGRLRQRIDSLCEFVGTSTVLMDGLTMMDRPRNPANLEKQLLAQRLIVSDIFLHFTKFDAEHRDPVVLAFLELRDISVSAWRIMSMFAFSNLFRLTDGTDFTFYRPEDAIFTQGRDYCMPLQKAAEVRWGAMARTAAEAEAEAAPVNQSQQEEEAIEYD